MRNSESIYKRGGITLFIPSSGYGIRLEPPVPYQYPHGHPCEGCPYTMQATVASCMFPARKNGGCFRYACDCKAKMERYESGQQEAAQKITGFMETLETVKRRKGYR